MNGHFHNINLQRRASRRSMVPGSSSFGWLVFMLCKLVDRDPKEWEYTVRGWGFCESTHLNRSARYCWWKEKEKFNIAEWRDPWRYPTVCRRKPIGRSWSEVVLEICSGKIKIKVEKCGGNYCIYSIRWTSWLLLLGEKISEDLRKSDESNVINTKKVIGGCLKCFRSIVWVLLVWSVSFSARFIVVCQWCSLFSDISPKVPLVLFSEACR